MTTPASTPASIGPVTGPVRAGGASLSNPSSTGSGGGQDQGADWEAWLSAWESHLDRMSDWLSSPEAHAPEPPTQAQPAGVPGEHLRVRLARADAAVADLVARAETAVGARSRWARATETSSLAPRAATTVDL